MSKDILAVEHRQMSMDFALDTGHSAAQACIEKADELSPGFSEDAYQFILRHVQTLSYTDKVSCETLVDVAEANGHKPHDSRAYGPIFRRLVRDGVLHRVGYGMRTKGRGAHGASIYARAAL